MKPIALYSRSVQVIYKQSLCSIAAVLVFIITVATILAPIYTTFALNGNLWLTEHQQRTQYEQPVVRFPYRFMLVGEFADTAADPIEAESVDNATEANMNAENNTMVQPERVASISTITSYNFLNNLLQDRPSVSIKHWTNDANHDGISEQIHVQFDFEPPTPTSQLSFLSLFIELNAHLTSVQSCPLQLPAALVLHRLPLPPSSITAGTHLTLAGRLRLHQETPFNCPNFIRKRQTYFQHLELIPANSTTLDDYSFDSIADKLKANVGYLEFESRRDDIRWKSSGDGWGHIRVHTVMDIGEIETRYWTGVGQQLFRVWMEYLAVLVVLVIVGDKVKAILFGRLWLRTWEVMPWKKSF